MKNNTIPLLVLFLLMLISAACSGLPSAPSLTTVPATQAPEAPPTAATAESAPLPDDTVAALDAFLSQITYEPGRKPEEVAPGTVLLVDTPDGRYLKAAGVASLEAETPLQSDARMEIGSNTKSFTVVLLLQLQEEGKLSMDDPLSQWLPDWAAKIPYGDEMTLRQLANHTAGLWDYGGDVGVGVIGGGVNNPDLLTKQYTPEELVQYAIDEGEPYFKPGEPGQWHYSNTGYILLGMVIEKIAGKPLGELYQERIFDPLGMTSAILIEGVPQGGDLDSDGYYFTATDEYVNTTDWNASQGWAAGALAMTAEDLLTYARALGAGELFQNPDTLQEMLDFNADAPDLAYMPYGLALQDLSIYGGAPGFFGHSGQTLGFATIWFTNPDTGVTVIGLSNNAAFSSYTMLYVLQIMGLTSE